MSKSLVLYLSLTLGATGCIQAALSAGQPTAMERQLLGAYEELDEELVLVSSVRGGDGLGQVSNQSLRYLALRARSLQRFNADDVLELKGAGCLYESLGVELVATQCELLASDPAVGRRRGRVIDEENRARAILIRWAAREVAHRQGRAVPSSQELSEVRAAYLRLLEETAVPGHLVETKPGEIQPVR